MNNSDLASIMLAMVLHLKQSIFQKLDQTLRLGTGIFQTKIGLQVNILKIFGHFVVKIIDLI